MNDTPRPTQSSGRVFLIVGAVFLAIGIRQPAFIGVGAAFIAIGAAHMGRNRKP